MIKEKLNLFFTQILPRAIGKAIVALRSAWNWVKPRAISLWKKVWPVIREKGPKFLKAAWPYALTVVLTATLTALIVLAPYSRMKGLTKLSELEALILEQFIGDEDKTKIEDAAASAMIGALDDRWSYYIPADEFAEYQEQKENAYVGIGITIQTNISELGLTVTEVTQGGSAEQAGIIAGDIIVAVDGERIAEKTLDDVKNMIRGEVNTTVKLTVMRQDGEVTVTVTRKQIVTPVAVGRLLSGNIGVIKIENFNSKCASETIAAIESLRKQGAEKLIFDVRYNPGGYADELVKVLDYLLPEGALFRSEDYKGREEVAYSDANYLDMPMAVLVNGSSYSAAEFFAAALSEYEAAKIVGEQTSGKGFYQKTFVFSDGSAVGLSVGKYYTPRGDSLDGKGLMPDYVVPVNEQIAAGIYAGTLEDDQDPQLQAAVAALSEE